MSDNLSVLTDTTFDEAVKGCEQPLLVDFWAEWCGPCKMVAPILEQLAAEYAGQIVIAKLDVDANPEVAGRLEIQSVPSMIIFQEGEPKKRITGARGKAQILQELAEYL
ncbi:MAG TPA: thioredoxin [Acidimicrobiales bacterium]|nr:thioredoxin [Acidimicrobiales bacterium]